MKKYFFLATVVLFFLLLLIFFGSTVTLAATVRINPTKIRLSILPGESKSGIIEVVNPSEEALIVKAYLQDWAYTSLHDGTKEFFNPGTMSLSCAEWINISLSEFVIPAFGNQKINYTVRVPVGAQGGRYAVLFFETLMSEPQLRDTVHLGVVVRIGALFYIEPQGTIKRLAEINHLSLKRKSKDKPLEINLVFKNTGNVDITCQGTFHIIDKQGMVLARAEFNDTYTFPQEVAKLSALWKQPLQKGKYDLVFTLDMGKALEETGLGRGPVITKEAELEIGNSGEVTRVSELR